MNLPVGFAESLERSHAIQPHGEYVKMWLPDASATRRRTRSRESSRSARQHADELARLLRATRASARTSRTAASSRPTCWRSGPWFGLRERGELVCVGGVHVFSRRYGVAALGNVATAPERRGRGLARAVCARLCRELAAAVPLVGLNVAVANEPARACYRALGFREALRYEEAVLTRRAESLC